MITVNRPFPNLDPLTTYLDVSQEVTESPTEDKIVELELADMTLTSRAVFFPKQEYVQGEGYRTFGFEPYTISDGITGLAHVALHAPGSQEYKEEYYRRFSRNLSKPPSPGTAAPERRRDTSRAALIELGGKLAVSGAFYTQDIVPAYEAIRESMGAIDFYEEDFVKFGLGRISQQLLETRFRIARSIAYEVPISSREARVNTNNAWKVVGRPSARTRISAFLA